MSLRKIIMIVIYSLLFTSIIVFNTNILIFFHKIGIDFSNLCGINPNLSVTIMGAGFANDITILLFFSITTLELVVSEKIYFILDYVDTVLWKLLKN